MSKDIKTQDVGYGQIELNKPQHKGMIQLKPVEIYHKEDGSKEDKPSFCFIMRDTSFSPKHLPVCAQVSLEILNEAMHELGYEIKKIPEVPCKSE